MDAKVEEQAGTSNRNRIMSCLYGKQGFINFLHTLFSLVPTKRQVYKSFNYYLTLKDQLYQFEQTIVTS